MCGIAGIVATTAGLEPAHRHAVEDMLASIAHRGPDASATHRNGPAVLGTVRLALVDKPTSSQPMSDPSGRWTLSFNGEIYNFRELRARLESAGVGFRTSGDTEVLLQALIAWGLDALPLLRGQFALAFWDSRERSLTLARDRFGIVPLFYSRPAGLEIVFGSEVKALRAGGVDAPLSVRDIVDSGVLWGLHPGRSCFEGIESVRAGGYVVLHDGELHDGLYWTMAFAPERDTATLDEQAARVRELLAAAVARRLPAYGDPAVLLSGGLDSSAVLALVREAVPDDPIDSFSIQFQQAALDEASFQGLAVGAFDTRHTSIVTGDEDIAGALLEMVLHAESPLVRTAPAASIRLAATIAGNGTRAVLSGEGADELFCGYDLFKIAAIRDDWSQPSSGQSGQDYQAKLEQVLAHQRNLGRAVERAFFEQGIEKRADPLFSHLNRWAASHKITRYLREEHRCAVELEDVLERVRQALPPEYAAWSAVEQAQFLEVRYFLGTGLLATQCDRPYMAHSVEGRYPFLDEDLVDYALTLPESSKLQGTEEKRVLKQAVAGAVPEAIVTRVKQPYTAPEGDVFRSPGGAAILEEYASSDAIGEAGIFDAKRVEWLIAKLQRGRTSFHDDLALLWIVSTQILASVYGVADTQAPTFRERSTHG